MKLFGGVTLEDLEIEDDEPVFIVRASDPDALTLIRKAALMASTRYEDHARAKALSAFADEVFEWQHAAGNAAPIPEVAPPPRKRSRAKKATKKAAR